MDKLPFPLPNFAPGWVWLAGAGPGDPGLLTLHVLNGLRQADVVVYDALVGEAVLTVVPTGCALEYAGKRGGKPSPTQPDITRRLIDLAGQGKRVLRLKGGDPFVFGRGGEEALGLAAAGVPFRVIPGISAGIGGLAYAGIPVTHRDTNSVVTFLTGHNAAGVVPDTIDWAAVARGSPVIVLYMGLKHLGAIAGKLLAAGRSAEEPVAVVSNASLPQQRVVETTLGACGSDAAAQSLPTPTIVVIGEVVRLRASLDWLGALSGP
jgi:uroporphyrin-III C-methyltransferase